MRTRRAAEIAEGEGHHPDVHLTSYRNVRVVVYTHAILGSLSPPPSRALSPLPPPLTSVAPGIKAPTAITGAQECVVSGYRAA